MIEMDPARLTDLQLDALREVTNIGCGAAATALSQLLGGRRVEMAVTRSHVIPLEGLATHVDGIDEVVTGVHVTLRGGAEGRMMLVYPEADGLALGALLAGDGAAEGLGASALMEVGNIVSSAYLNAVGAVTGLILLPSVPHLVHDRSEKVAAHLIEGVEGAERVLVLETWLAAADTDALTGHVVIVPDEQSLDVILGSLGL